MRAHYSKGMSRKAFDARLQELLDTYARRIERIRMIQSGELQAKRVWIKPFTVRKHTVKGHFRYITKPISNKSLNYLQPKYISDLGTAQGLDPSTARKTKKGM